MGHQHHEKPPLGVAPRWISDADRLRELARGILWYSELITEAKYKVIKPWAEEIVDICDNAEYGKHDH